MSETRTYPHGMSADEAHALDLAIAEVTTHPDEESGAPAEHFGPSRVVHPAGRDYLLLLPEGFKGGTPDPDAVVSIHDVAEVTVIR